MDGFRAIVTIALTHLVGFSFSLSFSAWAEDSNPQFPRRTFQSEKLLKPSGTGQPPAQKAQLAARNTAASRQSKCSPECGELLARARQSGLVNVIVVLDVPGLPDMGRANSKEEQFAVSKAREQAIAHAQDRFLLRLTGHKVKIIGKIKSVPNVGLFVDENALKAVVADPEVASIYEDVLENPLLPQSTPLGAAADEASPRGKNGSQQIAATNTCKPSCDERRAKVNNSGSLRVIVLFHIPGLPDASPQASMEEQRRVMQTRREAISKVQDRALKRLASYKTVVHAKSVRHPDMALTIDAAALEDLISNPEVIRIGEEHIGRRTLSQSVPLIGGDQGWNKGALIL